MLSGKMIWIRRQRRLQMIGYLLIGAGALCVENNTWGRIENSEMKTVCPIGKYNIDPPCPEDKSQGICGNTPQEYDSESCFSEELLRAATVRVVNSHSSLNGKMGYIDMGSGVCVENSRGDLLVVTAAHVFGSGVGSVKIRNSGGEETQAQIVLIDKDWDIAVAWPESRISNVTLSFSNRIPTQNTRSYIAGYGSDNRFNVTTGYVIGYSMMSRAATYETLRTAGPVRQGDSGGPVVDDHNEIIGIVWGTDGQASYATWNGRIKKILAADSQLGFDHLVLKETIPGDDKTETPPHSPIISNNLPKEKITDSSPNVLSNKNPPGQKRKKSPKCDENLNRNISPPKRKAELSDGESNSADEELKPPNRISPRHPDAPNSSPPKEDDGKNKIAGPYENVPRSQNSPLYDKEALELKIQKVKNECRTILLTACSFPLSGWGLWLLHRWRKRRRALLNRANQTKTRQDNPQAISEMTPKIRTLSIIDQNNEYAQELNDLYDLNGRNSVADATCGRLYDIELEGAEQSSDPAIASYAASLRRKIKQELVRIHSGVSVPAS